jgi:hypothetical protein
VTIGRRTSLSLAVLLGAIVLLAFLRPPAAATVVPPAWQPRSVLVAGAFHVHTNRSDGSGSVDDVARAAAAAGLTFVVITDHRDATIAADPPAWRSGVLIIDGVELNTGEGHYAVAGMARAAEPLGTGGAEVVARVNRLGGFGVVSHGDSSKPGLEWRDWHADIDGLEWANFDSAWRVAPRRRLARAALTYWLRKPEALASILARPEVTLRRFDELTATRPLVLLAATDAHGPLPSYEACFRAMTTRVELDAPLSHEAAPDAAAIVSALAAGHHHTVIDGLAGPGVFEFVGRAEEEWRRTGRTAREGDTLPGGGRVTLEARVAAPPGSRMTLLKNGAVLRETGAESLIYGVDGERAAYRIEVQVPGAPGAPPVPWIVSNPIYVGY